VAHRLQVFVVVLLFHAVGKCPEMWIWLTFGDSGIAELGKGIGKSLLRRMNFLKVLC